MTVLLADSFDLYADLADVTKSGWTWESANQTFSTTNGRFGGGCLQNAVSNAGWRAPAIVAVGGTVIIAFAYYVSNRASGTATDTVLTGYDRAGSQLFRLEMNTSGDLKAYNQPNSQVGSTASAVISDNAWHWIEVKVVLGTGAADGSIEVKLGGSTIIGPVTSIDTNNGNDLSFVYFAGSNGDSRFDDVIIMDGNGTGMNDFIGDSKIDVMIPNSDGSTTDWTASAGSDYQCVDDTPNAANDDTDYVYATSPNTTELQLSNFSDNPTTIHAVQVRTRSRKTDAGARTYRANILSGGSQGDGITMGLTTNYAWRRNGVFSRNPNGSVVWTKAAVNALQVELELLT